VSGRRLAIRSAYKLGLAVPRDVSIVGYDTRR
jgi:DNA-binding LacI/PurR family transcriptional regulator